jgi:hypothetical protein
VHRFAGFLTALLAVVAGLLAPAPAPAATLTLTADRGTIFAGAERCAVYPPDDITWCGPRDGWYSNRYQSFLRPTWRFDRAKELSGDPDDDSDGRWGCLGLHTTMGDIFAAGGRRSVPAGFDPNDGSWWMACSGVYPPVNYPAGCNTRARRHDKRCLGAGISLSAQEPGVATVTAYLFSLPLGGKNGPDFSAPPIVLAGPLTVQITVEPTIQTTPEYRAFLGLKDPVTKGWDKVLARRCKKLIDRADAYRGATSEASIPGETLIGRHSPTLLWSPPSDLYVLLALNDPPRELFPTGNVYARATPVYEQALQKKILASRGNLQPADVLFYALRVTNGSYPLAVLTAHNLLKNATMLGRRVIFEVDDRPERFKANPELYLGRLRPGAQIAAKLANLRRYPLLKKDKLGPWYHAFAILSAGALVTPQAAHAVTSAEHLGKLVRVFKGEGGFDDEKYRSDRCFADAAVDSRLRSLSRW